MTDSASYLGFALRNRRFLAFGLIMTFGSAFGPPLMGWAIDAGIGLHTMIYATVVSILVATGALSLARRLRD